MYRARILAQRNRRFLVVVIRGATPPTLTSGDPRSVANVNRQRLAQHGRESIKGQRNHQHIIEAD
jgi:hypothetical protein